MSSNSSIIVVYESLVKKSKAPEPALLDNKPLSHENKWIETWIYNVNTARLSGETKNQRHRLATKRPLSAHTLGIVTFMCSSFNFIAIYLLM